MKLKSILTSAIAAVALGTAAIAADIKVGFVYVGPVGDGGWTYEHDQGRKAVGQFQILRSMATPTKLSFIA